MFRSEVVKESQNNPEQWIVWGGTGRETDWFIDDFDALACALLYVRQGVDAYGSGIARAILFHEGHCVGEIFPMDTKSIMVRMGGCDDVVVPLSKLSRQDK